MFAMGIMLLLIGYGLMWTGVERFRGDKVSLLGAFGLPGGTVTTIDPGGATGPGGQSAANIAAGTAVVKHATGTSITDILFGGTGAAVRWVFGH